MRVDRYPTFLYPLSAALWATTGWGFGARGVPPPAGLPDGRPAGAAERARAQRSKRLIGAALVWVGVNLVRWLWVSVLGPPPAVATLGRAVFDVLTLTALAGWLAYPALLLDAEPAGPRTGCCGWAARAACWRSRPSPWASAC